MKKKQGPEGQRLEAAMKKGIERELEANPEYRGTVEAARRLHDSLYAR